MTKHILDRSRPPAKDRLERALGAISKEAPNRATLTLQQRERISGQSSRFAQFLRIARNTEK